MRIFLLSLLLSLLLTGPAQAAVLLDCNFNFGPIAQIQILDGASGAAEQFRLLTSTGRWLAPQPLPAEQWHARDLRFSYRTDSFRFHSRDGRHWSYEVSPLPGRRPDIIGTADCD